MKKYLLLTLLAVSTILATTTLHAEGDKAKKPPGGAAGAKPAPKAGALTPDEQAKRKAAHDKALADNAELKAEDDEVKKITSSKDKPTPEQAKKVKEHKDKMREAMIAADPDMKAIFEKVDAAQKSSGKPAGGKPKAPAKPKADGEGAGAAS